nr:hypothetical protein [Campylobacter armoricus]
MRYLIVCIIGLFLHLNLNAKIVSSTSSYSSSGEGVGVTRDEAVNNAIIEAIGKLNGVSIDSAKEVFINIDSDSKKTNIKDNYKEELLKVTKGKIDTYEINNIEQNDKGYTASVTFLKRL